jgi:hypothetical protein
MKLIKQMCFSTLQPWSVRDIESIAPDVLTDPFGDCTSHDQCVSSLTILFEPQRLSHQKYSDTDSHTVVSVQML